MNYLNTPQRVFYLINNPNNTRDNRSLWDKRVTRSEDSKVVTTEYTEIIADKDNYSNDFSSVVVNVIKVIDTDTYDEESDIHQHCIESSELAPMKWNELTDEVVRIIDNYYNLNDDNIDLMNRLVSYADSISDLTTIEDSVKLTVDKDGLPEVTIEGLPTATYDEYEDNVSLLDMTISSTESRNDYELWFCDDAGEVVTTMKELRVIMDKADLLDMIYKYMASSFPMNSSINKEANSDG